MQTANATDAAPLTRNALSLCIGTAGWAIPRPVAAAFGEGGSVLERYASRFRAVEINSSFHRSHRPTTWARWAQAVPADFRFSVKLRKHITHELKLHGCRDALRTFFDEIAPLGPKHAILLVQLPPKLAFDATTAAIFFDQLAALCRAQVVCEPRHCSWFEPAADQLLRHYRIARVAADPALVRAGASPGGWTGLGYWRLHGSPQVYRSLYGAARLGAYATQIARAIAEGRDAWCIFDNTATGAATKDAIDLQSLLGSGLPASGAPCL